MPFWNMYSVNSRLLHQKVGLVDERPIWKPYRGFRQIWQVVEGSMVVVMLDPPFLLETVDVAAWLKSADSSALQKYPSFVVHAGSSIYIPFGWMGVCVGYEKELYGFKKGSRKPKPTLDVIAFIVHFGFHKDDSTLCDAVVCNHVGAHYALNQSMMPASVRDCTGEWKSRIELAKSAES